MSDCRNQDILVASWDDFIDGLCGACKKVGEQPNAISSYFHHVKFKADMKQAIIDGDFDDKISEAEYKCEGDR